ncbi:hypothetical protein CEXT_340521, partial [Caerostris extrusa]
NDSGTNNIANPYQRNKDPPFCFQGKTKPEPTDHVFEHFFFFQVPNFSTLRNSRCLRSLCEKAIRKLIAQPERRNMKLLAWTKRNHLRPAHRPLEKGRKGCWEIDGKMAAGQRSRWPSRNIRECMVIIQFCRWK